MQKTTRNANAMPRPPVRPALPSCVSAAVALLACGSLMRPALAEEPVVNTGLMQLAQTTGVTPGVGLNPVIAPPALPPGQNPYALADTLKIRRWIVPLPGTADTIDQGLFGVRNKLAEYGISYLGLSATTFQDNLLRHGPGPFSSDYAVPRASS